jgi:hypothetical protein
MRTMRRTPGSPRQSLCSLLVALLIAMLAAGPTLGQAGEGRSTSGLLSGTEADELIAEVETAAAAAAAALEILRSDRLQPEVVVGMVGAEPAALRDWVTEETRWLPYPGALRGARGVLLERAGNSLDRSLLLAELLTAAGHEDVRLARATLPVDRARALAEQELSRAPGGDAAGSLSGIDQVADYRERSAVVADALAALLGMDAGDAGDGALWDAATAAMADHWWVRLEDGSEWLDLDPLLGEEVAEVGPATTPMLPADLPDEVRHAVTLRVVLEREDPDGRTEEVALESRLVLAEREPLRVAELSFDPAPGNAPLPGEIADLEELALLMPYWRPVLQVGESTILGDWFSTAGRLEAPGGTAAAGGLSDAVSGLEGLGQAPAEGAEAARLTAAWIEHVIEVPGRSARVERRELFDLAGATRDGTPAPADVMSPEDDVRDRGLALLGTTVILVQASSVHPDAILDAHLRDLVDSRSGLIALAYLAAGREDERIAPSLAQTRPRPLSLLMMAAARDAWAPEPRSTFLAAPNIWSEHVIFDVVDGVVADARFSDIVVNDVGVRAGMDDPWLTRLRQGVLDTLVEHVLMGDADLAGWGARLGVPLDPGTAWAVWRSREGVTGPLAEAVPPGERARIAQSLDAGHAAVVSGTRRARGGVSYVDWWRVAPDGSSLGMGYRGWGAAGEETVTRGTINEAIRVTVRRQARSICQRFGVAVGGVDEYVVYTLLMRTEFPNVPLLPSSRAQQACVILR